MVPGGAACYDAGMTEQEAKAPSYTEALQEVHADLSEIKDKLGIGSTTPTTPTPTPTPPTPTPPIPSRIQAVYWVNQSQGDLSDADAAHIVTAANIQAAQVVNLSPTIKPVAHSLWTGDPAKIPADGWPMYWLPTADVAGALGYHDVDPHGKPYGRVFTRYKGHAFPPLRPGSDGLTISNISLHEGPEIEGDPPCTYVVKAPNGDEWALELCDPVESFVYDINLPDGTVVSASDFVTAAFFGQGHGPYDFMGKAKPFTIAPGGYAIINNQQVFADKPSLRFLSQQGTPASRTARRLAAAGVSRAEGD